MQTQELTDLQIFEGLDTDDANQVCSSLLTLHFEAGQTILTEGDSIQALWIIIKGKCVVSRSCDIRESRELATLEPGDVFGEMSFVRKAPHSASIKAVDEVTVCSYMRRDFMNLLTKRPEAAWQVTANIADVLAERLRRMDRWVCETMDQPDAKSRRNEWESFRSAVYTNWNF